MSPEESDRGQVYPPRVDVVVDEFDSEALKEIREKYPDRAQVSIYTEDEIKLIGERIPTRAHRINRMNGADIPVSRKRIHHEVKSDIAAQYSILDVSVNENFYNNPGTLKGRLEAFQRFMKHTNQLKWVERHVREVPNLGETPDDPSELEEDEMLMRTYIAKKSYSHYLKRGSQIGNELKSGEHIYHNNDVGDFPFTKMLRQMFEGRRKNGEKEDIGIMVYGSATQGVEDVNNYDTLVIKDRISLADYHILDELESECNDKPIDITLVERRALDNFIKWNSYSTGMVKDGVKATGNIDLPAVNRRDAAEKRMSHSAAKLPPLYDRTLNWAEKNPEHLASKEGLVRSMSKTPRYLLRGLLTLKDVKEQRPHKEYSNDEIDDILREEGVATTDRLEDIKIHKSNSPDKEDFRFDPSGVRELLYEIMEGTKKLVDRHYNPEIEELPEGSIAPLRHDQERVDRIYEKLKDS